MPLCQVRGNTTTITAQGQTRISNGNQSFSANLNSLIVSKITDIIPTTKLDIDEIEIPNHCVLADPNYMCPEEIDILLGNEIFFDCIRSGKICSGKGKIKFQETVFGYVANGGFEANQQVHSYCGLNQHASSIERSVEKFWQIEQVESAQPILSKETELCEEHFKKERKLRQLNQRLSNNTMVQELHRDFMQEYEELGHMEIVVEKTPPDDCYYLLHHRVYRPDKTTTKLCVVFNASAPTSTGKLLNDLLLKGDVIEDIFDIMIRFRKHKF